uniref:BAALC binder of MAP3K1 and KLF4 b n=1 Tax=Gasterosteus aculeatus aculeatus TaxID=481459 RepID=A0AAQ4RJ68_GASAC|nr:brain and acute leukemia cytoplasmic protein isoform X1 [Gasterosteus aculeatus aculeatus]XP_040016706.1 brain and acute leukemia cytoplasmic protein isoform X1 [Gasterosteus aculeatus aculeatus]XP_040016707.1 brain and acute leukemia cytoplasmic protein isoform X1 [Gasterosteus aculeatus aculeatus]XP_040016708.1 brain and acute leukemia cytoplasmic protein isoform X1 [Gasterosteus aculeatus aculeatus]
MGCGGSRTDALEPRYLESWTKETESTWLTSTDTDIPLSSIQSIPSENSEAGFASEKTISPVPDFFEDGLPLPAQAYLKVCSAVPEASLNDVTPAGPPAAPGTSPPKEAASPSAGTTVQRRSVLHTEEIVRLLLLYTKWQDNRMSTKQVTITVTQSIHRVDRNGKVKKSLTTYEVMKPVESLKQVAAQNARAQRN